MLNILTVDDDEVTQFHASQLLLPLGPSRLACSGEDAVERVRQSIESGEAFDLILMDVIMPGLGGLKAVSEIVGLYNEHRVPLEKRPKIVMLSAVDERETQIDALYACGADVYLTKPLDEVTLRQALAGLGFDLPEG